MLGMTFISTVSVTNWLTLNSVCNALSNTLSAMEILYLIGIGGMPSLLLASHMIDTIVNLFRP